MSKLLTQLPIVLLTKSLDILFNRLAPQKIHIQIAILIIILVNN